MVFQSYALFPHLNIWENVAYGLKVAKVSQDEVVRRTNAVMELMQLTGMERRFPNQLSGGQQQRVAIARALATKPAILLADEPTGNLDSRTSQDVLSLMKVTGRKFAQTMVMITHNEEIAQLSDRIVRIEDGRIVTR